jgi:hypothetical protein
MNADPASLDNLRDIVEPAAVSWWPLASGWYILFAILLTVCVALAYRAWRNWRANTYRRAAQLELQLATDIAQVSEVLKRTALVAFPRTDVASLAGAAWSDWLGQTIGEQVPAPVRESLTLGVYAETEGTNVADVSAFAAHWIQQHTRRTTDR